MNNIWLIGAGPMARDYIKVLENLGVEYITIGRGKESAEACRKISSKRVIDGGLETFLQKKPMIPTHVIIATPVQDLKECGISLIEYGVKNILIEKPAGINKKEIIELYQKSTEYNANVLLAYNRRFYSSTRKALEIIAEDGGVTSLHFEFTEWSHVIEKLHKPEAVFNNWFIGNSSHVADLAFYLIGHPRELSSFTSGSLNWHHSASVFCGAGISSRNIPFSYHANWESAGRWSLEILTKHHRLIFKPMEQLKIIKKGTIKEEDVDTDDTFDKLFKPGLYFETKKFIEDDFSIHCSIEEQVFILPAYYKIAGYNE